MHGESEAPAPQAQAFPRLSCRLPYGHRLEAGLSGSACEWGAPHWRSRARRVNPGDSSSPARDASAVLTTSAVSPGPQASTFPEPASIPSTSGPRSLPHQASLEAQGAWASRQRAFPFTCAGECAPAVPLSGGAPAPGKPLPPSTPPEP